MAQQSIITGCDILSLIQSSELTVPTNWKELRPKAYSVYITALLDAGITYQAKIPAAKQLQNPVFDLTSRNDFLAYGPYNQYHVIPAGYTRYMRKDDIAGSEIINKNHKTAPAGFRSNYVDLEIAAPSHYLPWTKVDIQPRQDIVYYGFRCPSHWRNIKVTPANGAFQYLMTEYKMSGLILNSSSNTQDFIVIQAPAGASIQNCLTPANILQNARFYDATTFAQYFDMRTYAGVDTKEVDLTAPAEIFVAKQPNVAATSTTTANPHAAVEDEGGEQITLREAIKNFATLNGMNFVATNAAKLDTEKVRVASLGEDVSLSQVAKDYPHADFYDENCIITLGTDGEHAVNVVVSDYIDLVFLAKGYARRMMKITPSDVRAIVSGSPRSVIEVFQAV